MYEYVFCSKCERFIHLSECFLYISSISNPEKYCRHQCDPEKHIIQCTVCGTDRPAADFRGPARSVAKQSIRRCLQCEKCKYCEQTITDYRKFACNTNACTTCDGMHKRHVCHVCKEWLDRSSFGGIQLSHKSTAATFRCFNCHQCDRCQIPLHANAFEGSATTCKSCVQSEAKWPCAACRKEQATIFFDASVFRHFQKDKKKLICLTCQEDGVSPQDSELYRCEMCRPRGHLKFPRDNIRDANKPGRTGKLVCTDCRAVHAEAEKKLQEALSHPDVWQCTCPGAARRRMHDPSNHRCRLYPAQAGQRRWPGGNYGISEADYKFLDKMILFKTGNK